ncbi:hypothetical protein C5S53_02710 [Methanophagales archaeon]|jgi:hypothetical protein|nr:hypothetical protein C5S53_02710 [Methanophagales archaeon]
MAEELEELVKKIDIAKQLPREVVEELSAK